MLEIVQKDDLKPLLKRIKELEDFKARVACPICNGDGVIDNYHPHNGSNWTKCNACMGLGLKEKGKVYCE